MIRRSMRINELQEQNHTHSTETAEEMVELFIKEKESINLSKMTLNMYQVHINLFLRFLDDEANKPVWNVCNQKHYRDYILYLQGKDILDVTVTSYARTLRIWFYWLQENKAAPVLTLSSQDFRKSSLTPIPTSN